MTLQIWILVAIIVALAGFSFAAGRDSRTAKIVRFVFLAGISLVFLAPFIWLVAATFKDPAVLNEYLFFPPLTDWSPATMNLTNIKRLFEPRDTLEGPVSFARFIINSLFLASATTIIQLLFSSMGGYALAKFRFRGQGPLMLFMLASMMIPPVILLAPTYEIMVHIGWIDTYLALLIPSAVSVFGMFLFRQAILSVPNDLIEAARIDGCGEFRIYFTLVMPLVRPMSGAFCLIAFLGSWNSFIAPNVYLLTESKLTLPVILNQYVGQYVQHYGVFLAGTLIAIIPPAILFFALQKEFVSGLTSGAVKG